jgi:tRNA(adenine34) deaminase
MKTRFILICQIGGSVSSSLVLPEPGDLDRWMDEALDEARAALAHDDVPVGALIVNLTTGTVVARGHNARERDGDPTAHAEMLALRDAAAALRRWRLDDHALVVTLEPCPMCAGAAWAARVPLIVFGAADERAGASGSLYNFAADPRLNHATQVIAGIRGAESAALLRTFFETRRG